MKYGLAGVAIVVALALPAAASGAVDVKSGGPSAATERRGGPDITFKVKVVNGKPVAIRRFKFRNLQAVCDGGAIVTVRGRIPFMKVNDRYRFKKVLRREDKKARVKGKIKRNLRKVRGKIRTTGNFAGATGCDSGVVPWRARLN